MYLWWVLQIAVFDGYGIAECFELSAPNSEFQELSALSVSSDALLHEYDIQYNIQ